MELTGGTARGCNLPSGKTQHADVALHPEMMLFLCSICCLCPVAAPLGVLALQGFTSALCDLALFCR